MWALQKPHRFVFNTNERNDSKTKIQSKRQSDIAQTSSIQNEWKGNK